MTSAVPESTLLLQRVIEAQARRDEARAEYNEAVAMVIDKGQAINRENRTIQQVRGVLLLMPEIVIYTAEDLEVVSKMIRFQNYRGTVRAGDASLFAYLRALGVECGVTVVV